MYLQNWCCQNRSARRYFYPVDASYSHFTQLIYLSGPSFTKSEKVYCNLFLAHLKSNNNWAYWSISVCAFNGFQAPDLISGVIFAGLPLGNTGVPTAMGFLEARWGQQNLKLVIFID